MPTPSLNFVHRFGGGLSSDRGAPAGIEFDAQRTMSLPFLLRAENIEYLLNGAFKKIGGLSKYNSTALESGEEVRGMFEYIRQGTAGSPTRKRVAWAGTKVKRDNNDGTFSDLFTGRTDNSVPTFEAFEDVLIMATDANEAPIKWDQTTATTLGGTPPNFAFMKGHVNRLWAAGVRTNPSRLYYSSLLDAEQWEGVGNSGTLDIAPDDGDVITGLAVMDDVLVVFKGPNIGSIHAITGATPSTFARVTLIPKSIGAVWHNLIFPMDNDLGFVDRMGNIRALGRTERQANFALSSLSRDIETILGDRLNLDVLKRGWAATDPKKGVVVFTLPADGSTAPNMTLHMDYRFDPPRFSIQTAIAAWSVALMSDPARDDRNIIYYGSNTGFLRKGDQPTQSVDGTTAISAYARTPFIAYGAPHRFKTLKAIGLGISPKGQYTASVSIRRESADSQVSLIQGGNDVLGPADDDEFTLDTSTLAGDQYRNRWTTVEESGQFREVSYEISNTGLNEGLEVHALHCVIEGSAAEGFENDVE